MKSIVDAGIPLALGSDGVLNPYLNIMFATIAETNPPEALTVERALVAYTQGSAFAEFQEKNKGTLAPGMLADLAILSQDIFTVPVAALPRTVSAPHHHGRQDCVRALEASRERRASRDAAAAALEQAQQRMLR